MRNLKRRQIIKRLYLINKIFNILKLNNNFISLDYNIVAIHFNNKMKIFKFLKYKKNRILNVIKN